MKSPVELFWEVALRAVEPRRLSSLLWEINNVTIRRAAASIKATLGCVRGRIYPATSPVYPLGRNRLINLPVAVVVRDNLKLYLECSLCAGAGEEGQTRFSYFLKTWCHWVGPTTVVLRHISWFSLWSRWRTVESFGKLCCLCVWGNWINERAFLYWKQCNRRLGAIPLLLLYAWMEQQFRFI